MGQTWQPTATHAAAIPTPASAPAAAHPRWAALPWVELASRMHQILASTVHR